MWQQLVRDYGVLCFCNPVWQWEFYSSAKWGTYIFCARSYDSKVVVFMTNDDELNVTNTLCNLNDHPKWIHLFFILFHSGLARINQLKPIVLLPQFQQLIRLLTQGGKTQLRLGKDNWIKHFNKIRNTVSWIMQLPALFQFLDGFY